MLLDRQSDKKNTSLSRFRSCADFASMVMDDVFAMARPSPFRLGRVKRIEELIHCLRLNAGPVVRYLDFRPPSVQLRCDSEFPFSFHSFRSIHVTACHEYRAREIALPGPYEICLSINPG